MDNRRADVHNAADPKQVSRAKRKEDRQREWSIAITRAVLSTVEGRAWCWERLEKLGVFRSIWHPSAQIHYLAGRQDAGHELMNDLIGADETLYLQMETEARARLRRERNDTDAAHTPRATSQEADDET